MYIINITTILTNLVVSRYFLFKREKMAVKKDKPASVYKVQYIGDKGQRTEIRVKATYIWAMEAGENPTMVFETNKVVTFMIPVHSFISAIAVEELAPVMKASK